jgi:hypothetical protein
MALKTAKKGFTRILQGFLVVLIFAISPLLISIPQPARAEDPEVSENKVEYWAVIVGVSDYNANALDTGNLSDAEDLYDELVPIWGEDHIKLLVDDAATKANISDAICGWLDEQEDSNDVVFFYFSGHGNKDVLAPYDSSKFVSSKSISADELQGWLDALEADNIVVILDSCRSGSLISDLSETGRIIIASSKSVEDSFYFPSLGHLVFTYCILDAFYNFVDSDEDNELSVEEIFSYAAPIVTAALASEYELQTPQIDDRYDGELELFYEATLYIHPKDDSLNAEIDGVTYSYKNFPKTFRWTPNSSHSFRINSTDPAWISSSPVTISQGGEHHFAYLDIESEYGGPQGEGWYEEGTTVNISIASPLGVIVRDVFTGWSGNINDSTSQTCVYMDGPKSIVANWHKDYIQLLILIAVILSLVSILLILLILIKRRKKKALLVSAGNIDNRTE